MSAQSQPSLIRGLDEAEAAARLRADGFNELPRPDRRTLPKIVVEVLREPMLALLLSGGVVYLLLGDIKEALVLLAFATLSIVITVVQETRTEKVLEALRDLTSPRALVIRGGRRHRIAGREVVRGDILVLGEGDRVPADAVLLEADDLETDESLLTGESLPVRKSATAMDDARRNAASEAPSVVFSGTLVVRGAGIAEVTGTGVRTEIGKIGLSLSQLELEPPRLRAQTLRLTRLAAIFGGSLSVLAVVLYGTLRGGWLEALLAGIALGMSMLPEEFPVVLAVFMAMGAWRISRAQVLTRRAAAIETLGSATVLCTDKTGTLTENRMRVAELRLPHGRVHRIGSEPRTALADGEFLPLVQTGALACAADPFDPMEKAFHELARARDDGAAGSLDKLERVYGLRPELLAVSHTWTNDDGATTIVASKGAPEAIARLCRLDTEAQQAVIRSANAMAEEGLRVLGVARATYVGTALPEAHATLELSFLGLVGLADPIRVSVPAAIAECRQAGIRVVMITGDYPETARSIASQAGIAASSVMTGDQLRGLDDAALAKRVRNTTIFARIMPDQKLRIVNALKANGEIVGMTGDGVNDAPSLKAAHIGIAMGGRGTDVAREASSIVLLNDDFSAIVSAIRLGRRIYDNLRKAMGFIFAVHVPIAGLALLPLLVGLPILFGPVHIALLEMVIDPVCSLVFEAESEEDDVMRRPPRAPSEPLFSYHLIAWSLFQGFLALVLSAAIVLWAVRQKLPENEIRSLAFFALVMSIVGLIFVNRSFGTSVISAVLRPNAALGIVLFGVAVVLSLTLFWPPLRDLARFGPLHGHDLAIVGAAGLAVLVMLDKAKLLWFAQGEPDRATKSS